METNNIHGSNDPFKSKSLKRIPMLEKTGKQIQTPQEFEILAKGFENSIILNGKNCDLRVAFDCFDCTTDEGMEKTKELLHALSVFIFQNSTHAENQD